MLACRPAHQRRHGDARCLNSTMCYHHLMIFSEGGARPSLLRNLVSTSRLFHFSTSTRGRPLGCTYLAAIQRDDSSICVRRMASRHDRMRSCWIAPSGLPSGVPLDRDRWNLPSWACYTSTPGASIHSRAIPKLHILESSSKDCCLGTPTASQYLTGCLSNVPLLGTTLILGRTQYRSRASPRIVMHLGA